MYNEFMAHCVLFVDGENFLHKIKDVLKKKESRKALKIWPWIDFNKLLQAPLKGIPISRKIFYASRLRLYPETKKKIE